MDEIREIFLETGGAVYYFFSCFGTFSWGYQDTDGYSG